MKKLFFLLSFFALNFYFSQSNYLLKLKFNERYFLSNFVTNKTNNSFVIKVFKKLDSIADHQKNMEYVVIMDSILKREMILHEKEKLTYTDSQKKEFDSLKVEVDNGNFLKLMKKAVQVNFDSEFLEKSLLKSDIKNFKINRISYNQFSITFSSKEDLLKTKTLFLTQQLFFHESIEDNDLEKIQNCFMKENDILVKNNYLKKEKNYLLIYKDDVNLFGKSHTISKCFDTKKITFVLNTGKDYEVFSKLYFVKKSSEMEDFLVKSIKSFDISFVKNQNSYKDNHFYLTVYLDDFGKDYLKQISEQNIGKKLFISTDSELLLNPKISTKLENGSFKLNGNLFEVNWQELYELVRFEVFKNSLTIQ